MRHNRKAAMVACTWEWKLTALKFQNDLNFLCHSDRGPMSHCTSGDDLITIVLCCQVNAKAYNLSPLWEVCQKEKKKKFWSILMALSLGKHTKKVLMTEHLRKCVFVKPSSQRDSWHFQPFTLKSSKLLNNHCYPSPAQIWHSQLIQCGNVTTSTGEKRKKV